jgi:hypothetical protein
VPLSSDGADDAKTPAPPPALSAPPCCAARGSCAARLSLDSGAAGGGGADGHDSVTRIFLNSAWRDAACNHAGAQLMSQSDSDGFDDPLMAPSFTFGADAENMPPLAYSELLPRALGGGGSGGGGGGGGGGHSAARRVSMQGLPRTLFESAPL